MSKLQNVTIEMLNRLADDTGFDIGQQAGDYADRMQKGYVENMPSDKAFEWGRSALTISRCFADLAAQLLIRHALAEQRRLLEDKLRAERLA
jgi:hypothetical protein